MVNNAMDAWLRQYDEKYTKWTGRDLIDHTSKVIPVDESLADDQWIIPTGQAVRLIAEAGHIALTDCGCRTHYQRCDRPVRVCLLLNDYGAKAVDQGLAETISLEEAGRVLTRADRHGLVHLSLYRPDRRLYALCSCCACCCHDLQLLLKHDRTHLMAHADYLAETDPDLCLDCGGCVERCVFGARRLEAGRLVYDPLKCYGCGLCVTMCPGEATVMRLRSESEICKGEAASPSGKRLMPHIKTPSER